MRGDASLLTSVDHGDRLKEMTAAMTAARASGRTTIPHYAFDSLFMTTKLLGSQSGVGIAFEARGTKTVETYDAEGGLLDSQASPFAETFVIRQALGDERWFNVGVLPGP